MRSNTGRLIGETVDYFNDGEMPDSIPAGVVHTVARTGGAAVHLVTGALDAVIGDVAGGIDGGVDNLQPLKNGPIPRLRRTTRETLQSLFKLKPLSFLAKIIKYPGDVAADGVDLLIGKFRRNVAYQLS